MKRSKIIPTVTLALILGGLLASCSTLLTDADWEHFEAMSIEYGWSDDQREAMSAEMLAQDKRTRERMAKGFSTVTGAVIDHAAPAGTETPLKGLADWGIYALLGVGGLEVARRKVKNAPEGKMFGPVNGKNS
jgi:hypothetical protein